MPPTRTSSVREGHCSPPSGRRPAMGRPAGVNGGLQNPGCRDRAGEWHPRGRSAPGAGASQPRRTGDATRALGGGSRLVFLRPFNRGENIGQSDVIQKVVDVDIEPVQQVLVGFVHVGFALRIHRTRHLSKRDL